jgi:hypothetical protein
MNFPEIKTNRPENIWFQQPMAKYNHEYVENEPEKS